MRKVKLYTINEEEILASDFNNIIQISMSFSDIIETDSDEFLFNQKMIEIPVHRVSRIKFGERKDDYIAIHPELNEILRAPMIGEIDELKFKIKELQRENKFIESDRQKLLERINVHNELSWFMRIFKKV